jgi:hypothetical protein
LLPKKPKKTQRPFIISPSKLYKVLYKRPYKPYNRQTLLQETIRVWWYHNYNKLPAFITNRALKQTVFELSQKAVIVSKKVFLCFKTKLWNCVWLFLTVEQFTTAFECVGKISHSCYILFWDQCSLAETGVPPSIRKIEL